MKFIETGKVINIMQKTLDCVDARLVDHGRRVAYFVFKILDFQNKYTEKQINDICILAMLHDIGAYKTEEIDKMAVFETTGVWEHSIYGYLFLKYFSPLKKLSPAVLFHHADCSELEYIHPSYHELAQIISLCDRADIFSKFSGGSAGDFRKSIEKNRGVRFRSDIVDLFFEAIADFRLADKNMLRDEKFLHAFYEIPLTEEEAYDYIKMTILSIEFRSFQTAIHTIAVTRAATVIASLLGVGEEEAERIKIGAMLHDIGKTAIPVRILESPNRLNEAEMEIMKTHINMTEKIIAGSVDNEVVQIAARHHEKLNGSGYPRGLSAADLSLSERILAVADIFSALSSSRSYKDAYPKEEITEILNGMKLRGLIDAEVVSAAIGNFDFIMEELLKASQPVLETYHKINGEYEQLLKQTQTNDFKKTGCFNVPSIWRECVF